MNDNARKQIESLHASLRDWALADVRRAFDGGAKVGAFILGAHLIDTAATDMAGAARPRWPAVRKPAVPARTRASGKHSA